MDLSKLSVIATMVSINSRAAAVPRIPNRIKPKVPGHIQEQIMANAEAKRQRKNAKRSGK